MTNDRACEILDPEHREHYDSIDPVNEACRMAISALRAQSSSEKPNNWIRVEDRLPEETDEKVIIACKTLRGKLSYTTTAYYRKSKGFFEIRVDGDYVFGSVGTDDVVTHWMPLPEPPEEAQK